MTVRRRTYVDVDGRTRTRWVVDIAHQHPDGRIERVRKTSPEQTRRGAERYERELRAVLEDGSRSEPQEQPEPLTVNDAVELYLERYAVPRLRSSTITRIRGSHRQWFGPVMGEVLLSDLTAAHWDQLVAAAYRRGLKPSSINVMMATLHAILRRMEAWGLMDHVPPKQRLRATPKHIRVLTQDEEAALLGALRPAHWGRAAVLMLHTGLRIGELLGLDWDDVCWERRELVVQRTLTPMESMNPPKGGKTRTLPLNSKALEVLINQRETAGGQGVCVFGTRYGRRFRYHSPGQRMRLARKKARLDGVTWHTLRHTYATRLVLKGAPLRVVQALLGHSSISMTIRYSHLSADSMRAAVTLLDD